MKEIRSHDIYEDQSDKDQSKKNSSDKKNKEKSFQCTCGKYYGSAPATHRHITTKHENDKKNYKVINVKNRERKSFKKDYIDNCQEETGLMNLAQNTFKHIWTVYKNVHNQMNECFKGINFQDEQKKKKNQSQIDINIQNKLNQYQITDLIKLVKTEEQNILKTFVIQQFDLNIVTEITNNLAVDEAWKFELQIYIILAKKRNYNLQKMVCCQKSIWGQKKEAICNILTEYCQNWIEIINKYNKSKQICK